MYFFQMHKFEPHQCYQNNTTKKQNTRFSCNYLIKRFINLNMTIDCLLDAKTFKDFTFFNIIKRLKYYKSPVIFACILTFCAAICFIMYKIDGAILLGTILLVVGLGMPIFYFTTFFISLKKQVKAQNLENPRLVYSITLENKEEGISISNDKEKASYKWEQVYHVYYAKNCIYLFMTKDRAFLLPNNSIKDKKSVVSLIDKKCKGKVTTL